MSLFPWHLSILLRLRSRIKAHKGLKNLLWESQGSFSRLCKQDQLLWKETIQPRNCQQGRLCGKLQGCSLCNTLPLRVRFWWCNCNEYLQVKMCGQKGRLWDTLWRTPAATTRFLLVFWFGLVFVCLFFILGGRLQGQRADMRGQGDEWDWGAWCETHKESIKSFKKFQTPVSCWYLYNYYWCQAQWSMAGISILRGAEAGRSWTQAQLGATYRLCLKIK